MADIVCYIKDVSGAPIPTTTQNTDLPLASCPEGVRVLRESANSLRRCGEEIKAVLVEMCIKRFTEGDDAVNEWGKAGKYIRYDPYFEANAYSLGADILERASDISATLDECADYMRIVAEKVRDWAEEEEELEEDWEMYRRI